MIRKISAEETLPLRSKVLRNNKSPEQCVFPADHLERTFHLGCFERDRLVCIATFFPEDYPDNGLGGIRLRGMATDPDFAGRGFGARLINFAIKELIADQASYIWCNARSAAMGFYLKLGFEVISEEFEVPGIGPHFDMRYQLNE